MKTKAVTLPTGNIFDPVLEEMLQKRDSELKVLAEKNAKNFAQRKLPNPKGDSLLIYTSDTKAGYEKLAADTCHYLQPEAHFPEAKIDAAYFKEKAKNLDTEINDKEAKNQNDENALKDFARNSVPSRITWALVATLFITIGEIAFNTKSFQIVGESMLFALLLSCCVSASVLLFSHIVPMLYKGAISKLQRIIIVAGSLLLITCLFIGLSVLRSSYLATHEVYVKPSYFVIINLFFFIVSALVSFFVMPTWAEIKQNALLLKLQYTVKRRKKEIERLKAELEKIKEIILERTKIRIRITHLANYTLERIRKMYYESIGIFKTTNMIYRSDNTPPDCFSQDPPIPEIESIYFTIINHNDDQP
jgi:hypothetical protein